MYVYFGPKVESSNRCLEFVFDLSNVSLFNQAPLTHMTPSIVLCQSTCCPITLHYKYHPQCPQSSWEQNLMVHVKFITPLNIHYSSACSLRLGKSQLHVPGIVRYSTWKHYQELLGTIPGYIAHS